MTLPKVKIRILNKFFLSFNFANLSVTCNDEPKALGANCYNYVGKIKSLKRSSLQLLILYKDTPYCHGVLLQNKLERVMYKNPLSF